MSRNRGWLIRLYYEHVKDAIPLRKSMLKKKSANSKTYGNMALPLGYVNIHIRV